MPVWVAIVIGLGSGVIGTLATITHQRGAEFRTRMIEAADELLAAVTEAALRGRDVSHAIGRAHHEEGVGVVYNDPPGFDKFASEVDVVTVQAMRISLVFGISEAAAHAQGFIPHFRDTMSRTLYMESRGEEADFKAVWEEYVSMAQEFIEAARDEIRSTSLTRRIRRLARR